MNWEERWHAERARLIAALGWLAAGGDGDRSGGHIGLIEQIVPLGAGGLPRTAAADELAIGIATWPFPPEASTLAALAGLGYVPLAEQPDAELRLFQRTGQGTDQGTQLLVAESGSTGWTNACLLRAFAAANEAARTRLAAAGLYPQAAGALLTTAATWWPTAVGFAPLQAVVQEMAGCPCPWAVSSGWALDLFLGPVTRVHHDVDLIVDRSDQFVLRSHMEERGYRMVTPLDGRLESWPPHMRLELPRHQVHAHRENDFIDLLLTDFGGACWHYRRDPIIVRSLARAFRTTEDGTRYLAPELVLLFKSKNTGGRARPQDQRDFELVLPHLDAEPRAWLHWALVATDPQHPWLGSLAGGGG